MVHVNWDIVAALLSLQCIIQAVASNSMIAIASPKSRLCLMSEPLRDTAAGHDEMIEQRSAVDDGHHPRVIMQLRQPVRGGKT
jgi:hypothetical protein